MTNQRIASVVAGVAMLAFGTASCDIFDPYDPRDPGHGDGDTIIYFPNDSCYNPKDSNITRDDDNQADFVRSEGTIVFVELEGGFWGIEATNGEEYEPINLSPEFMVDGLKVKFEGNVMKDWASFYQWGKVLEVGAMARIR